MVFNLKERIIARKFSTEWNTAQAFFEVSGNTIVTITISPPKDKFFIITHSLMGEMIISPDFIAKIVIDGTTVDDIASSGAIHDKWFTRTPLEIVKNELVFTITNNTSISHVVDFILFGFNIRIDKLNEFLKEVTGETNIEVLNSSLINIGNKLDTMIELLKKNN